MFAKNFIPTLPLIPHPIPIPHRNPFLNEQLSVRRFLDLAHGKAWDFRLERFKDLAVTVILRAQELVRGYNIARVHVSIRDLLRAVNLLQWIVVQFLPTKRHPLSGEADPRRFVNPFLPAPPPGNRPMFVEQMYQGLCVGVMLAYYLRLPSAGHVATGMATDDLRTRFCRELHAICSLLEKELGTTMELVLRGAIDHLWKHSVISDKLAHTQALKENIYCIAVATNSRLVNVLITGPPGCGKTLSYSLVMDNMKGSSSESVLMQHAAHLHTHPYQCSEHSTAAEITAVYKHAIERQRALDRMPVRSHLLRDSCIAFVDEAGLPKERRQTLKVFTAPAHFCLA